MRIFIHRSTRDSLADDLKRAETNNSAFDAIIARIRSDSSIKPPEMNRIASEYLGRSFPASTSKTELIRKIVQRQVEVAYEATKMIQVAKASRF